MDLVPSQHLALETLAGRINDGSRLVTLSGAAGTGKTTLIKSLIDLIPEAVVCTPTNKAAQVLQSKDIDASTFFKKFYVLEETPDHKPKFTSCKRWVELGRDLPPNKLDWVPTLIIDEASMVTTFSCRDMQRMCQTLVLVGDHHQLPPVGDRENPAGLFGSLTPTAELTEIMRQQEGSLILTAADAARRNDPKLGRILQHFEPQVDFRELAEAGAQMICFTNKERQRINHLCRMILGFTQAYPQPGDKMVVTNNYSEDLINGTVVEVIDFDWDNRAPEATLYVKPPGCGLTSCKMSMLPFINDQIGSQRDRLLETYSEKNFDDEVIRLEATFAYCLTAHKAQGSEWESVVVFDQRSLVRKVQASNALAGMSPDEYARRWIYTCITRAKKNLYVAPTWYANIKEGGWQS